MPALLIADGTTNGPPFSTQVTMIDMTECMGMPGRQPPAARRPLDPAPADRAGDVVP